MSDLFWLSEAQMARLAPFFPKSHGRPRVDDRRVLSGIIFINRNGLRWRDAPKEYGPHKTLYNRWKRWSDKGVFARIMIGLAAESSEEKTVTGSDSIAAAHSVQKNLSTLQDPLPASRIFPVPGSVHRCHARIALEPVAVANEEVPVEDVER